MVIVIATADMLEFRQFGSPFFHAATQTLVICKVFGHKVGFTMKLTIAFLAIVLTLGFGACSTPAPKEVSFTPCCATGAPAKDVTLIGPWEPGGTVVRLTSPTP